MLHIRDIVMGDKLWQIIESPITEGKHSFIGPWLKLFYKKKSSTCYNTRKHESKINKPPAEFEIKRFVLLTLIQRRVKLMCG